MSLQKSEDDTKQINEIFKKIDTDILKAFTIFINATKFGTFSFIIQDKKIIGYDQSIKERK